MKSPRLLASKAARPFLFAAGCVLAVVGVAEAVVIAAAGTRESVFGRELLVVSDDFRRDLSHVVR